MVSAVFFMLVIVAWIASGVNLIYSFQEVLAQVNEAQKGVAILVLILGAPFFFVTGIMSDILDKIFPEGWDDEFL